MRFDVAIKNLITQNTAIADEIAGIYPVVVPANVSAQVNPVLVYNQVSTSPISTKSQYGEYDRAVIQLSIFCKSLDKCQIIAAAIRAFLDRYSGTITVAGTDYRIDLVRFQNQEFVGFDEDNDVFMIAQDYQFAMTRFWTFGLPTLCGSVNAAQTNSTLRIEDFPLLWLIGNGGAGYYDSYKGDTFEISGSGNCLYGGSVADYDAVTSIGLNNKSLTTDFNKKLLYRFNNLDFLNLNDNRGISVVDLSSLNALKDISVRSLSISVLNVALSDLRILNAQDNQINSLTFSSLSECEQVRLDRNLLISFDATSLIVCTFLEIYANNLTALDLSAAVNLVYCRVQNNLLSNLVNSQLLIDLDSHGKSNGFFQSSIFGGGSLTTAGAAAKTSLQSKGWNIVGL